MISPETLIVISAVILSSIGTVASKPVMNPVKDHVLPSGKVSFDAERTARGGHADRFWAIALACQKERGAAPAKGAEIGVRVVG